MHSPQLQELTSYILEHRRRGFSRADLEPLLTEAGWDQADQEYGFKEAEAALNERGTSNVRGLSSALAVWVGLVAVSIPLVSLAALYLQTPEASFKVEVAGAATSTSSNLENDSQTVSDSPDFLQSVRATYIENDTEFIEADLSSMTLRVQHGSTTVLEVPIESKGREGSWWETPAG